MGGMFWSLPGGFGLTQAAYQNAGGLEDALRNAASWACIRVLVDSIARTPITAERIIGPQNLRTPITPTPRILARPSAIVQVDTWKAQLAMSLLSDGNVFGDVAGLDPRTGLPTQIEIRDPSTVTDRKVVSGVAQAQLDHGKIEQVFPFGKLWHLPGDMVLPGSPFALSPLTYASKVIGTSLAAEDFSYRFFADGGHPPIALVSDVELDDEQSRDYKQKWQQAIKGTREPVVMGSGIKVTELHLDPSETQFIDLMRFCVEQACRFWGVPPSMVFAAVSGQHMTYANVTEADLHFLKHALEGKFTRIENGMSALLPGNAYSAPSVANTVAVMDRNAVLKADVKTRYQTHVLALQNRFKTINEVRMEEGDLPFDGPEFDAPGVPPFAPTLDPNEVDLSVVMTPKKKQSAAAPANSGPTDDLT